MLSKERAADMYRLSAYFVARTTSDLPLDLILPVLFILVVYFMAGLRKSIISFVLTQATVFLCIIAAQVCHFFFCILAWKIQLPRMINFHLWYIKHVQVMAGTWVSYRCYPYGLKEGDNSGICHCNDLHAGWGIFRKGKTETLRKLLQCSKESTHYNCFIRCDWNVVIYYKDNCFNTGEMILQSVPVFISWLRFLSFNYHTYKLLLKVQYEHISHTINGVRIDSGYKEVGVLLAMVVGYRILAYLSLRRMKLHLGAWHYQTSANYGYHMPSDYLARSFFSKFLASDRGGHQHH